MLSGGRENEREERTNGLDVKSPLRIGIQATDNAFYICYGRERVLPEVDRAIYASRACENRNSLEGVLELLLLESNWIHTRRGSEERRCTLIFLSNPLPNPRSSERPPRCQRSKTKKQPRKKARK